MTKHKGLGSHNILRVYSLNLARTVQKIILNVSSLFQVFGMMTSSNGNIFRVTGPLGG